MRRAILVAALATASSACIVDRSDGVFDDQQISDGGSEVDAGALTDAALGEGPGAGTMSGTWLLAHQASNCVLNQEQVSVAFYLMEIDADGPITTETRRTCAFELSPVLGLRPIIPSAVSDNIEFVSVDSGYFSTPSENGAYTASTEVALWGVDLEDPRADPLPTDPDDPRVVDADGDGNPGVTFQIEGSECVRYVSQRQIVRYQGVFVRPNLIEGGSLTITDTVLYEASQPLCGVDPDLIPNDAFSEFRMARIDGLGGAVNADIDADETISCDEAQPYFEAAIERREPYAANCR